MCRLQHISYTRPEICIHPGYQRVHLVALVSPFNSQVLKYFSYEHFYVIYCKFWELDSDHDFLIDRSDLAHYSQCALSFQIIDRVFEQVCATTC